jgi:hypothetical protein
MRLPLTIICSIALLAGAAPLAAHADPRCESAGWTDPATGPHPDDGPCTPGDAGDVTCRTDGVSNAPTVAVSVTTCVPKPISVG